MMKLSDSRPYRLIDHTADFGLVVYGRDEAALFANAGRALMDQITHPELLGGSEILELDVPGLDRPDLMVNWLREILYLWTGKEKLVKDIDINSLSKTRIRARLAMDSYDPDVHIIKQELKAVTYHQIEVEPVDGGWRARVIFDV